MKHPLHRLIGESIYQSDFPNCQVISDSVVFIQIVDTSKLKQDATSKLQQFKNLSHSIRTLLPLKGSSISEYRLIAWNPSDSKTLLEDFLNYLRNILKVA